MSIAREGEQRWDYINSLDEELVKGGVILSEWSAFLVRDADTSYCAGANLAAILTCMAGIEAHLRYEYGDRSRKRHTVFELIEAAPIDSGMRRRLHALRRFRNIWTHVEAPEDDARLLSKPSVVEGEIAEVASGAVRLLREVIYLEQWL